MRRSLGIMAAPAFLLLLGACTVVGYPSPAAVGANGPAPSGERATSDSGDVRGSEGPDASTVRVATRIPESDHSDGVTVTREPMSRSGNPKSYEQFGERYEVLASGEGYDETGLASWYGQRFAGRPTASGEIFDPDLLTAAHRTLPLPSWVEVENLDNGRRVVVRVNDRGPFADTDRRIIDLSRAAAEVLGMRAAGVAPVRIRMVAPPIAGGERVASLGPEDFGRM